MAQSQPHPQHDKDLAVIQGLSSQGPTDLALAELARLWIRYEDFPGAEDIRQLLVQTLQGWDITLEQLFEKTRQIHREYPVFRGDSWRDEDWA